jgi:hypothetical protein
MDSIKPLLDWAQSNDTLLWWLFAVSVAGFLLTPVAVGWTLVRLPRDYFTKEDRRPLESWAEQPALRYALLTSKNLLGVVLLAAGLLMLLVPGQGLLTIVVGLILTDFPGKFRLQRPCSGRSMRCTSDTRCGRTRASSLHEAREFPAYWR